MKESLINVEFYPNSVSCQHGTPFCKKEKRYQHKKLFLVFSTFLASQHLWKKQQIEFRPIKGGRLNQEVPVNNDYESK